MRNLNMDRGVRSKIERSQKFMAIYPCIYVVLTLPLAFGRMYSMAHDGNALPDAYMLIAGCLITSCGWMDALMYTLTRNVLHTREGGSSRDNYSHSRGHTTNGSHLRSTGGRVGRTMGYQFEDFTALRSNPGEWDGDSDTTPPGTTTTTIIGGKEAEIPEVVRKTSQRKPPPIHAPPKAHKFFGLGRRNSNSNRELSRVTEVEEHKEREVAASYKRSSDPTKPTLQVHKSSFNTDTSNSTYHHHRGSDSSLNEPPLPLQGIPLSPVSISGNSTRNLLHKPNPARLSPGQGNPYYASMNNTTARSRSPANVSRNDDEPPMTHVTTNMDDYPLPPASPPFGQVKVETQINVTRSDKRDARGSGSSRESSEER